MKFFKKFSSNWEISFFFSMFTTFVLSLSVSGIFLFTSYTSFYIEIGFGLHFINYVKANLLSPVGTVQLRGRLFIFPMKCLNQPCKGWDHLFCIWQELQHNFCTNFQSLKKGQGQGYSKGDIFCTVLFSGRCLWERDPFWWEGTDVWLDGVAGHVSYSSRCCYEFLLAHDSFLGTDGRCSPRKTTFIQNKKLLSQNIIFLFKLFDLIQVIPIIINKLVPQYLYFSFVLFLPFSSFCRRINFYNGIGISVFLLLLVSWYSSSSPSSNSDSSNESEHIQVSI